MAADMLTNHQVRDLDDHDLSVLHTRNTQNGLVGVACVNPLHKKISRPGPGLARNKMSRPGPKNNFIFEARPEPAGPGPGHWPDHIGAIPCNYGHDSKK